MDYGTIYGLKRTESSFAIRLGEGAGGCFGAPSFAILRAIGNEQMRLPALVVTSFGLIDHGVVGGILKSMKIDKIHNMHAPKFQGRVFSEVAEAPQAAPTRRTLVGDPETGKQVHFSKMYFFQNSNLKCWDMHRSVFHMLDCH